MTSEAFGEGHIEIDGNNFAGILYSLLAISLEVCIAIGGLTFRDDGLCDQCVHGCQRQHGGDNDNFLDLLMRQCGIEH